MSSRSRPVLLVQRPNEKPNFEDTDVDIRTQCTHWQHFCNRMAAQRAVRKKDHDRCINLGIKSSYIGLFNGTLYDIHRFCRSLLSRRLCVFC